MKEILEGLGVSHVSTSDTDTYTWRWDTRNESNGEHAIMVKASDAAGNSGTDSCGIYKLYTSGRKNNKR